MAYEFKKLSEVESIEEFPEGAKVLIENNGSINRCAADGLGGGGGYHWIHLNMDPMTYGITCDEEITFDSLKADIVNGLMPVCIMYAEYEGTTQLYLGSFIMMDYDADGTGRANFAMGDASIILKRDEEDGPYVWAIAG